MTTPKAVVFDLGKVLLDFDYGIAIARIQKRCRLSLKELHSLINQSPLLLRYESNSLSTAEFFAEVQAASGFCGNLDEFRSLFSDIFTVIEPMAQLHGELRRRGVPTFIFSNTNELAMGHIRARFSFVRNFDGYVLSYEHNAMKPDPSIYRVVEQTTGQRGPDLLYIDDRSENVTAGQARGWQTILHRRPEETKAAVLRTGLLGDLVPALLHEIQFAGKSASKE
jgi:HAD superfamily hydrolase (TIGR01509 family)